MVRQFRPQRVYQIAQTHLANRTLPHLKNIPPPPWLEVIESIPPSEILTRPLPVQHHAPNPRLRKPSRTFIPQQIVYEEDALRQTFYKDHPWELARPRTILETDGKDSRYIDWSRGVRQPGVQLTGEWLVPPSVVGGESRAGWRSEEAD